MSVNIADFRVRFPEYSDVPTFPDARIQLFLDDAELCIDEDIYGPMYDLAVCYLAAHELKLATDTSSTSAAAGNVGPVSSKTAGGVSKTMAIGALDMTESDSYYALTTYGLKFLNIRDKVKIPGFRVIANNQSSLLG